MTRVWCRDLAWALVVGTAVGVSPHPSSARLTPKIVAGVAVAALVLAGRVYARRGADRAAPDAEADPRPLARTPATVWIALALFCAVFAPTAVWMYGEFTETIWRNGHGLFIPLVMAYLARPTLYGDAREDDAASPWGFSFLAVGLVLAVVGSAVPLYNLSALGLVLCLPGLCLLLLGPRRTRALAPLLFLGLLLVPIPTSLAPYVHLPVASATGAKLLLGLLDVPVTQEGSWLILTKGSWYVSNRCSGFSALVAAVGVSVFLAFYSRSVLRSVALLLLPWLLVFVFNSFRTFVFSVYLEYTGRNLLETALHGGSGIVTFWAVMGPVLLLADWRTLRQRFS